MIPDDAVEAAVGAMSGVDVFDLRAFAVDILEAAAPYLLARQLSPTRWWRAIAPDGSLLAETSSTGDFTHLDLIDNPGVTFQRLYEETPESEWREEAP